MANPHQGTTRVLLADGEEHTLRFTANALAAYEEETGMKIGQMEDAFQTGDVGITDIRAFVWAGLLHKEDPDGRGLFTVHDAGELVPLDDLERVADAVQEALGHAMGIDPDEVDGEPEPQTGAEEPTASTGTT